MRDSNPICSNTVWWMAASLLGCGADGGGGAEAVDGSGSASEASPEASAAETQAETPSTTTGWGVPQEALDFRIVYQLRGRVQGTESYGKNELYLTDPLTSYKYQISSFSEVEWTQQEVSCEYGCFVSSDLQWVAVTAGPPDAKGFDFYIGQFKETELEVQLIKNVILKDKIDFHFAPGRLYFTELAECGGASCQYKVKYLDLAKLSEVEPLIFPPAEDLEQSTFKGHFKVSPDGKQLVFLNTTIRSVGVYLWRDGTGLTKLDFICKYGTEDNCQGTGSEYSDLDPVAISNDGRHIVFFTFSDRWQMARIYDTLDPQLIEPVIMASVPSGSYIEKICDFGALQAWQWQRVVQNPIFTPEDHEVIFLTENACPAPNGAIPDKAQRNLMRVKFDRLLEGGQLTESDVFSVTQNPQGNVTGNRFVTGFDLSPDGATIVFAATPTYMGAPPFDFAETIEDGNARQETDRELYRVRRDGKLLLQMTGDVSWEVQSPRVAPPAP